MKLAAKQAALPRRPLPLLLAVVSLGLIWHLFKTWGGASERLPVLVSGKNATQLAQATEDYLEKVMRNNDLTHKVHWAAWHVKPTQSLSNWKSLTALQQKLEPRKRRVFDLDSPLGDWPANDGAFPTLDLPSPMGAMPGESDASDYLFGVSTTYERLMKNDRALVRGWQWWLTNGKQTSNGAHLVVILDSATSEQLSMVEVLLKSLDIAALVYKTDETLSSATRYLQMTKELRAFSSALTAVGQYKKWFFLLDDSVFFPNMAFLGQRLSAYDPDRVVYVGLPSEGADWGTSDGKLTTSGGGAVALSREALNVFLYISCTETKTTNPAYHSQSWGTLLHECLTTNAGMKMQVLPGLYSPHFDGNSSGVDLYESGGRPLALHGRATTRDFSMAYLVADECGEACFMQRYLSSDGWLLVNGISISQYHGDLRVETVQRHATNLSEKLVYEETGEERVRLRGGEKRSVWKLADASLSEAGVAWQAYVKKAGEDKNKESWFDGGLDEVIVFIWDGRK